MTSSTYPFSTSWTGGGDGTSWSDPNNWSNGLPPTSAAAPTAADDLATIDNSVVTSPFTVVIAQTQSVGQLNVAAADPAGGVAVSLTGTLSMSVSGSGFGVVDLTSGTFEIDGGTLSGADVQLNGGTLAFGSSAQGRTDTLAGTIIDGPLSISNASDVVIAQSNFGVFDGVGGYGNATVITVTDGATFTALGSIYLDGEIDVQNGTLVLAGGSLNGWGGTGTLFADGGTISLTADTAVNSAWTIEGGLTFAGADTLSVGSGGSLTLGNAALSGPTVVNLDGGTIDVFGALALQNTILENGTVVYESGSTRIPDSNSSLSNVTVIDNRPAGQTNWTGAAADGDWSNAANWTNGVPQSGLGQTSDGQSIAVINDAISVTPATITIAGAVNAQDIDIATNDPASGPSVLLTGTLDTSWNGEGSAYGQINLNSGTFEVDGGSISYTGISLNGGNLTFGTGVQNTFNTDIFNGTWGDSGALVVLTGYDTIHGQYGSGPTTVTLSNGAQLLQDNGTLQLDGELDIQDDGGQGTLFSLNGGNLSGYGGDAATIFIDGGTFAIDANTIFSNAIDIYGGYMVFGDPTDTVTIDNTSVTTIGQTGANQTLVNLNGATLDVFGTLNLTNTIIENGTITLEADAIYNTDNTDTLINVTVTGAQTVTNWTSGVINNTGETIDAGTTPFSLMVGETIEGGTIIDPAQNVTFLGGTLEGVTYQGLLDLSQDNVALTIDGGITLQDANGNSPGTVSLDGYQDSLTFDNTQTFDNATINLTNDQDGIYTAVSQATYNAANQMATPITVTLGANAVVNSNGYDEILGNPQNYPVYYGATTLINNGMINVTAGSLLIDPNTFVNNGTITVAAGASLDLEGNWSDPGTVSIASGANIELGGNYTTAALSVFNASGNTIEINGTLDNTGATLNVGNGATYAGLDLLRGATIKGGTINDAGSGIAFSGGTLDNVSYEGTIDVTQANTTLYASDGLELSGANGSGSGVIDLTSYDDSVVFNDTQTLDNATINLSGGEDTLAVVASYAAFQQAGNVATSQTLTLGNNLRINQIGGYNYLGGIDPYNSAINNINYGTTTLINNGIIDVNGGTLVINPSNFINKGTINVASGATLYLDSNWTNLGTISLASGATIDVGGTFTVADLAQFNIPGVTLEIGGVLDNTGATLNVGSGQTFAQLTLENGGSIKGGTVIDSGGIVFNGGTLDGVTYDGDINLATQYQSMGVADGSVFRTADGTAAGSITLSAYDQTLNLINTQTIDNVTINLSGQDDQIQIYSNAPQANGAPTPPTTVTLGANVVINTSGPEFI